MKALLEMGVADNEIYKPLRLYAPLSSTSLGEPDRLFGINCGHTMRGVSDGTFINREEQYDKEENDEEYKKVQAQRVRERQIRKEKTQADMLDSAGDSEGAKLVRSKAAAHYHELKAYCDSNGLSYRQDRTQVYGYAGQSGKAKPVDFVETVDKAGESGIIKENHRLAEEKKFSFENYTGAINPKSVQRFENTSKKLGYEYVRGIDKLTDGRATRKILHDVDKLSKQYGQRFSNISIMDFGDEKAIAETLSGELRLNSRFMNKPNAMREVLNKWEKDKFIPKGCNTIQYVAKHEYYHLLTQDMIDELHSKMVTLVKRTVNDGCEIISENGRYDCHEFVADLFSAKTLTKSQKKLKDSIMKILETRR